MASSKKHPFNPVAPVFGKIPELKETEGLLENVEPSAGFASEFLNCPVNVNHAKAAFIHVRANGKGKPLFKTEAEFLSKLDDALLHFEMFRTTVLPDGSCSLNDQRDYFKRLAKAASSLNEILASMNDNLSSRLAHAGFVLPQILTEEGLDNDFIQKSKNLEAAARKAKEELRGKNSGHYAELYLLIEQLADMHDGWPTRTTNHYNKDNKGAFFDLIQIIYPLVDLSNRREITDEAIINGIKLARKR